MGAGQSREELLYQEVQNGNHDAVKALRREGASLEWVDKEGRTPLILACTRGELFDMAITLLNLGANMNAYRPGTHGGLPLHHAAKRGLEKTVNLLLSNGADPLAINDDGQTPLEMARSRGHLSVVRLLEERLCLFNGMLRELAGLGILEALAPGLVTKKIWAVVLPTESHPKRAPKYELAIYQSPKVAQPRIVISLAKAEIEEPNFNSPDPVLYVTDRNSKAKYKFLSENEGDKAQLERLYKACRGIPQVHMGTVPTNHGVPEGGYQQGNPSQIHPIGLQSGASVPVRQPVLQSVAAPSSNIASPGKGDSSGTGPMSEEMALALALNASIQTATVEGVPLSPAIQKPSRVDEYKGWGAQDGSWGPSDLKNQQKKPQETSYSDWEGDQSSHNGWGPAEAGPSRTQMIPGDKEGTAAVVAPPSAPPLPDGPICYPSVDITDTEMNLSKGPQDKRTANAKVNADDKPGAMCVVCWDAPAEGACIPCGHIAGCMNCLSEIKAKQWGCPVCRGPIEQVIRVYAV